MYMNVCVWSCVCVNLCICAYVYAYICVKACEHRYMYICVYIVYIVHVYMYCVTCVWYEHVCVCMYVSVWRWKVKKVKCLPNCSPFYSLCPSTEPESCLLDRTGWQVDSRSPLCLLCPLSRLQKHCTVSIFHWVLGGSNSGLPAYTPSTIPTEPSRLFHNFLLDRNHLTGQPHRQCEWTQKFFGHTQTSVCN